MRIKEGFVLRRVGEIGIVVPAEGIRKGFPLTLNDSGVFLWSILCEETDVAELVQKMEQRYDVPIDIIAKDVRDFLRQIRKIGLLEE